MMIKLAGGPAVSPLDYGEHRKPVPGWVWGAVAASVLLHGAGAWLSYTQRFERRFIEVDPPEPPPVVVTLRQPAPPVEREASPTPVHKPAQTIPADVPPISLTPVEPLETPATFNPIFVPATPDPDPVVPTATPTPAPPTIVNPRWERLPSAEQMRRAYPQGAIRREVEGEAMLRCSVTARGSLT